MHNESRRFSNFKEVSNFRCNVISDSIRLFQFIFNLFSIYFHLYFELTHSKDTKSYSTLCFYRREKKRGSNLGYEPRLLCLMWRLRYTRNQGSFLVVNLLDHNAEKGQFCHEQGQVKVNFLPNRKTLRILRYMTALFL